MQKYLEKKIAILAKLLILSARAIRLEILSRFAREYDDVHTYTSTGKWHITWQHVK